MIKNLQQSVLLNKESVNSVGFNLFFKERSRNSGRLVSVKSLSPKSLLISTEIKSYDDDGPSLFPNYILYSIETAEGQFYLITEPKQEASNVNIMINNYFVDNLHL